MEYNKQDRILEIFFRAFKGEALNVRRLAKEYGVSLKTVGRDIKDLRAFLANHRELAGYAELRYFYREKCYRLGMDDFLTDRELFALLEVMIGARAFSKEELLILVGKLQRFVTPEDRPKLKELVRNELYHYAEVKHDCESVQETLWELVGCITDRREITIEYYRMDRDFKTYRILPVAIMFSEYYFYLIAFPVRKKDGTEKTPDIPIYFRVDRVKHLVRHRVAWNKEDVPDCDEGLLRRRSLFMWSGKLRTIRFEFSGPSVQAVLDRIPTARIIERNGGTYTLEAEVYGDGIKMWLLSQGGWVKVTAPGEFVDEMIREIGKMADRYQKAAQSGV